jgi:hypothetical protein
VKVLRRYPEEGIRARGDKYEQKKRPRPGWQGIKQDIRSNPAREERIPLAARGRILLELHALHAAHRCLDAGVLQRATLSKQDVYQRAVA